MNDEWKNKLKASQNTRRRSSKRGLLLHLWKYSGKVAPDQQFTGGNIYREMEVFSFLGLSLKPLLNIVSSSLMMGDLDHSSVP